MGSRKESIRRQVCYSKSEVVLRFDKGFDLVEMHELLVAHNAKIILMPSKETMTNVELADFTSRFNSDECA
jgi:hypothetical protein